MKVDLAGLFSNVAAAVPKGERDYYKFCLEEVLGHIRGVVSGEHTVQEFAEHYCLTKPKCTCDHPHCEHPH